MKASLVAETLRTTSPKSGIEPITAPNSPQIPLRLGRDWRVMAATPVKLGNTRTTGKEQYYTPISVADEILANLEGLVGNLKKRTIVEPAGGTGSFIVAAGKRGAKNFVSYDIEPHHPQVTKGDFLKQRISGTGHITVSNPPFGRNNALSIPFFNHAAESSDLIAFIVPRSWRKWSVQNRLDRRFHLIRDDDLDINYVDRDGELLSRKNLLRTCVQYWQRGDTLRPLYKVQDMNVISRSTPADADASLTVFGYGCGTLRTDFERVPNTTQMFITLNHPKVKKAFRNGDFSKFYNNTAYTEALSLPEINYVLNEEIFGDPKLQLLD